MDIGSKTMQEKIQIRNATKKDLNILRDLQHALVDYHHEKDKNNKTGKQMGDSFEKLMTGKIRDRKSKVIIVWKSEEPIGYCYGSIEKPTVLNFKEVGHISDLFVKESFRSRGIGKMVLDYYFDWFRKNNIKIVQLSVHAQNPKVYSFYKKLGFKENTIKMIKLL